MEVDDTDWQDVEDSDTMYYDPDNDEDDFIDVDDENGRLSKVSDTAEMLVNVFNNNTVRASIRTDALPIRDLFSSNSNTLTEALKCFDPVEHPMEIVRFASLTRKRLLQGSVCHEAHAWHHLQTIACTVLSILHRQQASTELLQEVFDVFLPMDVDEEEVSHVNEQQENEIFSHRLLTARFTRDNALLKLHQLSFHRTKENTCTVIYPNRVERMLLNPSLLPPLSTVDVIDCLFGCDKDLSTLDWYRFAHTFGLNAHDMLFIAQPVRALSTSVKKVDEQPFTGNAYEFKPCPQVALSLLRHLLLFSLSSHYTHTYVIDEDLIVVLLSFQTTRDALTPGDILILAAYNLFCVTFNLKYISMVVEDYLQRDRNEHLVLGLLNLLLGRCMSTHLALWLLEPVLLSLSIIFQQHVRNNLCMFHVSLERSTSSMKPRYVLLNVLKKLFPEQVLAAFQAPVQSTLQLQPCCTCEPSRNTLAALLTAATFPDLVIDSQKHIALDKLRFFLLGTLLQFESPGFRDKLEVLKIASSLVDHLSVVDIFLIIVRYLTDEEEEDKLLLSLFNIWFTANNNPTLALEFLTCLKKPAWILPDILPRFLSLQKTNTNNNHYYTPHLWELFVPWFMLQLPYAAVQERVRLFENTLYAIHPTLRVGILRLKYHGPPKVFSCVICLNVMNSPTVFYECMNAKDSDHLLCHGCFVQLSNNQCPCCKTASLMMRY